MSLPFVDLFQNGGNAKLFRILFKKTDELHDILPFYKGI